MGHFEIKLKAIELFKILIKKNIHPDLIMLFGSTAKNKNTKYSDIDIAIISRDFKRNSIKQGAKINALLYKFFPKAEAVLISLDDYLDPNNTSPLIHEIKTTGIPLL